MHNDEIQSSVNFAYHFNSDVSDVDTNATELVDMLQLSIRMHLYLIGLLVLYGCCVVNLSEGAIEIGTV